MAPARIYGIIAPKAKRVVLFRRGPSQHTLQLVWDLETDKVTPGQWIKGRVFVERSDVSPDGRYLVTAISNYTRMQGDSPLWFWTAISRPPYFTAIAFYESTGCYDGGGVWQSKTDVWLNNFIGCWEETRGVKPPVKAQNMHSPESYGPVLWDQIMLKRGWQVEKRLEAVFKERNGEDRRQAAIALGFDPSFVVDYPRRGAKLVQTTWTRAFKSGSMSCSELRDRTVWKLFDPESSVVREWTAPTDHPFWLEVDQNGWPIFSETGCLYRWTNFPHGEPTMVADLNHYTFEPVAPPAWATKW